jgi:hypothetical protein
MRLSSLADHLHLSGPPFLRFASSVARNLVRQSERPASACAPSAPMPLYPRSRLVRLTRPVSACANGARRIGLRHSGPRKWECDCINPGELQKCSARKFHDAPPRDNKAITIPAPLKGPRLRVMPIAPRCRVDLPAHCRVGSGRREAATTNLADMAFRPVTALEDATSTARLSLWICGRQRRAGGAVRGPPPTNPQAQQQHQAS